MAAGYSTRSLAQKLGIKPGTRILTLGAPPTYPSLLGKLPDGATLHGRAATSSAFIHWFVRNRDELETSFPRLTRALSDEGMLWVSWPKQSSGVQTDLNENIIREVGLQDGLVDVKVVAVNEVWSGLKFVRPLIPCSSDASTIPSSLRPATWSAVPPPARGRWWIRIATLNPTSRRRLPRGSGSLM